MFSRSSVKFQCHRANKIVDFDSNRAFPDCDSSFNSLMAMKLCTKLDVVQHRYPVVFQGHLSNFKVARDKNRLLTQIERFRIVAPIWIPDGFDMMHKAWCNIEEVHNSLSRSSIKLQGHMGWRIDDVNIIWVRLLGRSQLSNALDLPCYNGARSRCLQICA